MIYVDDLCRAIIAALESDCGGETFQIATGVETSILDLAEMLQAEMMAAGLSEQPVAIVHENARAGEIIKNYSSIEKARRMLGWSPQVSLQEGLRRTVAWFRTEVALPAT
jgi:UDP-glucose 4-epimerase